MPTYEYRCDDCGHEFEEFQSIKASSLRKCPECGKNGLKRLLGTGAGIIFKGSGFYQTDYRSESYKTGAKKEKDSKTSTKSESKKTKTESSQKDKCKTCPKKKK
ncbi:MAG: FmdB family zinc ribbon protein [Planctomycetota bacterium]|jgi:putative FmdB family regulatory protein